MSRSLLMSKVRLRWLDGDGSRFAEIEWGLSVRESSVRPKTCEFEEGFGRESWFVVWEFESTAGGLGSLWKGPGLDLSGRSDIRLPFFILALMALSMMMRMGLGCEGSAWTALWFLACVLLPAWNPLLAEWFQLSLESFLACRHAAATAILLG